MERRIDELGLADQGEFSAEEPALGDAVKEEPQNDLDGYVAEDGLMAPHQEPGEVRADRELEIDRRSVRDLEDLRDIHS